MSTGTILFLVLLVLAPLSMILLHGRGGHGAHGSLGCGGHGGHAGHSHGHGGRQTAAEAGQPAGRDEPEDDGSGSKATSRESDSSRHQRGHCC